MEKQQMDDLSPGHATKTWGFRRSTIARREFIEEIGNLDLVTLAPRRNLRQPKGKGKGQGQGKQPGETASKRARGTRRAVKAEPEPDSDDLIMVSRRGCLSQKTTSGPEASDQAEDSDELTLRELQERARKRQKLEENDKGSAGTVDLNAETVNPKDDEELCDLQSEENFSSLFDRMAARSAVKAQSWKSAQLEEEDDDEEEEDEQNDIDVSSESDEEYSDPNAVYCICQQKHNNRFMIRCDRCHEWFHGDCVGISAARGRLLEKNGEDYVCPSCTPCQSPVDLAKPQPMLSKSALSSSSESLFTSSAGEERPSEDEGIKGKIRKSSTRSTKRRIKIFQPVEIVEATSEPKEQAVVREQGVAEGVVKEQEDSVEKEKAAVPKCIGPGCSNEALPESVYCGHQCIIRHAAVAMHGLSEPKAQPEIKNKPAPKPTLKIHNLGKLFKKKAVEKPAEGEDGGSKEMGSTPTPAASVTPEPVHKAVGEQQPAAIASTQFYKATSTESEKEAVENKPEKTPVSIQTEPPSTPSEAPAAEKATEKPAPSAPPLKKPASNPLPSRAKKTMPGSPRLSACRQLLTEAPQANKSVFTVPKKPCQPQEASNVPQASNSAPEVRVLPVTPAPVPPSRPLQAHPNMQMRQNIRRSLTDTLLKRVNDSDDLDMLESEVEKLAVNIEREMFNMYYTTDSKYKIKYRSLLLSLKDPKNKGLFYQVVNGHITPFKLTRLSDQELLSVQESAANPVPLKEQQSSVCVDVEQPPSVSENKVVRTDNTATSSSEGKMSIAQVRQVQIKKPSTAVSDIISSMLKDTTAEHKGHLFDLKCKICTGQVSINEDPDTKTLKKDEPKNEQEEKPPCAVPLSDDKPVSASPGDDSIVMESPASPTAEECTAEITQPDFSPPVIPAVSIVTITRRDPRTAGYRSAPSPSVVSVPVPAPVPVLVSASASIPVPEPPKNLSTIPNEKETVKEAKATELLQPPAPPPPPPPMPKSILMKPSVPAVPSFYGSPSLTTRLPSSRTPADSETSHFLSRQDTIWKGFLNMQLVAKFVTKGCIISGSADVLKKDLPDTVHIGGRILPQMVWEYVERVKTSLTKELSLIRFYPASDEEEVAYVSLFSYFNSRRRFGVVSNICNNIKDLYLIPLCANESIPSILLPIEGPGLEQNHPNLLIGLAVCQKLKRPGAQTQDIDEKRPRIQTPQDLKVINLPTKSAVPDVKHDDPYDPDIAINTTPPGSPPSLRSPDSSSSSLNPLSGTSTLSNSQIVVTPPVSTIADVAKIMSSSVPPLCSTSSTTVTPLQTILNTIFGKKKQGPDFVLTTSETTTPPAVKEPVTPSPTVDPIIQQYQHTPKTTMEFDDNDRPYDPEEEYDPALGYRNLTPTKPLEMSKPNTLLSGYQNLTPTKPPEMSKPNTLLSGANGDGGGDDRPYDPEEEYNLGKKLNSVHAGNTKKFSDTEPLLRTSAIKEDVAYDPEDETVFEEMQNFLTDNKSATSEYGTPSSMSLSEQQKMLEDLNRQIEEQKRQLEEQEEALRLQRAAVGVSLAHFSVSDALMSPPPSFGREPDEEMGKTLTATAVNLNRDPRQYRHLTQNAVNPSLMGHTDKESVNEKSEKFIDKCPSNSSLEQDVSKNGQDVSLAKLDDKRPINADTSMLHSVMKSEKSTHPDALALREGASSSSGNENVHYSHSPSKDSGKTRQSHTSRRHHHSPPQRRSRHETRRSYHEKRTSDHSKDDAHRRRGRRSPERSSRRSRSCSRRKERPASREREWHHRRSTSRHGTRRDGQYSASSSRSTRRRPSPELENNQSKEKSQKEKLASRQKNEPNTQSTDGTNNVASQPPQNQSDKSQNDASGSGEPKVTKIEKADFTKPETDQSHRKAQPSSDLPCDTFSQQKQEQLEPNQSKANPLQTEDCHKNKPQCEKSSVQESRNNEPCNSRHGSQTAIVLHNETDFSHGTDEQSSLQESDPPLPPQKTPKIEGEHFPEPDEASSRSPRKVLPQRPPHSRGNGSEMMAPQTQESNFSVDDTLHPKDFAPQRAHSMASVDLPQLENDVHRNIHPRDQFRPRTPEVQWRGPQHKMGGPRGHTPVQPRIPGTPQPERFESCRPAGPRGQRPRIFDDSGPSPEFGPRGPASVPRILEGSGPRRFRPRGPSPVPRMFEGASAHPSGPKGRFPRPGMFESSGPQNFGPREAASSPDMFDGSVNFEGSPQREFDDPWGCDVPHQVDREPFPEFRRPGRHGPPQQFRENMLDSRDSEQPNFNNSRHCDPPFGEAEVEHLPLDYSDDPMDYGHNFADESFINPHEPREHRNPTPRTMRTRSPARIRNPPHNQPEGPQFPGMELNVKRSHQFDDFRDQTIEKEMVESRFAKPDIFESGRGCERATQRGSRGACLNSAQNLRGPRAPSPHCRDQRRVPLPRNTELPEDKPRSHFSLPSTSKPLRSQVPNASEFQKPMQSRIRLDGPTKEPDIRPLRLSGPLLPTPPGGPIRFHNPRMQRPYLYKRSPARGPVGDPGVISGSFDDYSDNQGGEVGEFADREEEFSRQDNNSGKPRCREARRSNITTRRGHGSERNTREGTGDRVIGRDRKMSRDTYQNRH